jgi:C-methyltransferase C-terminal domain/Putative zinc binding domain/Methyltransferase domain
MPCRSCGMNNVREFMDLGLQPASNALLESAEEVEQAWPLKAGVCESCWLIQTTTDVPADELFTKDYPYFSGQSAAWVKHCKDYAGMIVPRLGLNTDTSIVLEIGGNDGTLLKELKPKVLRAINIEPCKSVADASLAAGVETWVEFFKPQQIQADLIVANNVMAHTPDLNGFAHAIWSTLKPGGTCTIEFPWSYTLMSDGQFDTIYHEHYSYFGLGSLSHLLSRHQLRVYDAEYFPAIHGGSLRVFVHRSDVACPRVLETVRRLRWQEECIDSWTIVFSHFELEARARRNVFWDWLGDRAPHHEVLGYGAAAKGNTFLNYCNIDDEDMPAVADTTPAKIGKFLPGSKIRIISEQELISERPNHVLILPWNWAPQIKERLGIIRKWGGKFVTAMPTLEIWPK